MKKLIPFFALLLLVGCSANAPEVARPTQKSLLSGKVQKGPFIEGANVDIFELNAQFGQTGKSFSTTIIDKDGSYMQRDLQLSSQFVEIRANGFYFNEVSGKLSEAPLTLFAVANLTSIDNVNVNILTTLERPRIYQLLSRGKSFDAASRQAHGEARAVFGMSPAQVGDAHALNIEDDAMLLAISAIVQGLHSTAEITQLITSLSSDLQDNGVVDNSALTSALKNNFSGLNAEKLMSNLADYQVTYTKEDVQAYLDLFQANTNYTQSEFVTYPEQSLYGDNVLVGGVFQVGQKYSFAALTPAWASLKVKIEGSASSEWYYELMPDGPQNWRADRYAVVDNHATQTFTVIEPGKESILKFVAPGVPDTLTFTFYEADNQPYEKQVIFQ